MTIRLQMPLMRLTQKTLQLPLFLCLRLTQEALQSSFYFYFFCFSSVFLDGLTIYIYAFSRISALGVCDQYRTYYHEMPCTFKPCPLEKNSNGGFKRERVEPCTSTTMLYLHNQIANGHQT